MTRMHMALLSGLTLICGALIILLGEVDDNPETQFAHLTVAPSDPTSDTPTLEPLASEPLPPASAGNVPIVTTEDHPLRNAVPAERSLRLRLTDTAGNPHPQMRVWLYRQYMRRGCGMMSPHWKSQTNINGVTHVGGIDAILKRIENGSSFLPKTLTFVFSGHTLNNGCIKIPYADFSRDELHLQTPPLGSIRLHITDPDGLPATGTTISVSGVSGADPGTDVFLTGAVTDDQGFALVKNIEANIDLRIRSWDPEKRWIRRKVTTPGPRPDESLALSIPFVEVATKIRGRIVSPDGSPVTNVTFRFRRLLDGKRFAWGGSLYGPARRSGSRWPRTDDRGEFQILLDEIGPASGHLEAMFIQDGKTPLIASPTLDLSAFRTNVDLNLGSITVRELPPLLTGVVVNEKGEPLADAALQATIGDCSHFRNALQIEGPNTRGHFSIHGLPDARRGSFRAICEGHRESESIDLREAQSPTVIQCIASGAIELRVLTDPEIADENIDVFVNNEYETFIDGEESSLFDGLIPGPSVLELRSSGGEVLYRKGPIHISAGSITMVTPIDLRNRLSLARIHLQDENGIPVKAKYFLRTDVEGAEPELSMSPTLALHTNRKKVHLAVYSEGHRIEFMSAEPGDNVLVMRTPIELQLVPRGSEDVALYPGPSDENCFSESCDLLFEDGSPGLKELVGNWLRDHNMGSWGTGIPGRLSLPTPGKYQFMGMASKKPIHSFHASPFDPPPIRITY